MNSTHKRALDLHQHVPADYYTQAVKKDAIKRWWHKRRFAEIPKLLEPAAKILDVGCADGTFTRVIARHAKPKKITGIDVLKNSIDYAKKKFADDKRYAFRVADAHDLPFKNGEFDAIVCLETLEHVEDPGKVLSEIKRVLAPGGWFVALVPSENFLFRLGWPIWVRWRGKVWRDTHVHQFSGDQIVHLIKQSGFKIERNHKFILGMLQAVKAIKINNR